MNIYTKVIIIITIAVLLMLVVATQFKKLKAAASDKIKIKQEELKTSYEIFPLKKGSKGEEVKIVQLYVNENSPPPLIQLDVDGIFGKKTENMLQNVTNKKTVSYGEYLNMK